MKTFVILTFVVCSALAIPSGDQKSLVLRQRRDLDIFANTKQLIQELVENLRNAASDALEAIRKFEEGLLEQAKLIREKIAEDIQKLRDLVSDAIQSVVDKITGSGEAVRECIDTHSNDANALFNETMTKTLECADERIAEIGVQLDNLRNSTYGALEYANNTLDEMKKCVENNPSNIFSVGTCLGTIVVRTELKGAVFVTQSGVSIARLNLGLATVPAALEVCAGSHLVAAGLVTARIIMNIGSCSASSVFSTITGNTV